MVTVVTDVSYRVMWLMVLLFTSRYISMNNLNDPPNWNIRPNSRADGGDGSRWNYALLVPMLGLAAFRKSWFSSHLHLEGGLELWIPKTLGFGP